MALLLHAASAFALAPRGLSLQSVACGEVLTDADALACGRRHWHRHRHRRERQPRAACRAASMRLGGPEDDAVASSAWRWAKRSLPLLVTGASGSDGDAAPEAALFNLVPHPRALPARLRRAARQRPPRRRHRPLWRRLAAEWRCSPPPRGCGRELPEHAEASFRRSSSSGLGGVARAAAAARRGGARRGGGPGGRGGAAPRDCRDGRCSVWRRPRLVVEEG